MNTKTKDINIKNSTLKRALMYACLELGESNLVSKNTHIYAIPRGGLVLAQYIAYWFNLPKQNVHLCLTRSDVTHNPENAIICDDIYDSGDTLKEFKDFTCVSLFGRKLEGWNDKIYSAISVEHKEYVYFPWDLLSMQKHSY